MISTQNKIYLYSGNTLGSIQWVARHTYIHFRYNPGFGLVNGLGRRINRKMMGLLLNRVQFNKAKIYLDAPLKLEFFLN